MGIQNAMQGFTEKIVALMKSENLFESQGGPIILAQVSTIFSILFILNIYIFFGGVFETLVKL